MSRRDWYKIECSYEARLSRRDKVYSAGCVDCHTNRIPTVAFSSGGKYIRIPLSNRAEGYGGKLRRSQWGYLLSGLDFTDHWLDVLVPNGYESKRQRRAYWAARSAYVEGLKAPGAFINADVEFAERTFKRARKLAHMLEPRDSDYDLARDYLDQLAIYRVCESRWVKDGALELMTKAATAMYVAAREAYERQRPPRADLPDRTFTDEEHDLAHIDS
jgi:hypothetical protein